MGYCDNFVIIIVALIFVAFPIAAPWAYRCLQCYEQDPGEQQWGWGRECPGPAVCVRVKNCRAHGPIILNRANNKEMKIGDEVRGCYPQSRRNVVCVAATLAACDCKICSSDYCNAALCQKKMPIGGGIMMFAFALAMTITIFGLLGHLFVPPNLLMIAGGDG